METTLTPILTTPRCDMAYCPGCTHGLVLEHFQRAVERLGLPAERVCLVTDIGCIGIADRYFACHTFHGLHGRSVTYAEGISRMRPDLLVVVLIGDGGCGIGTGHLVHAARRNARVKVIVCNNFNFGMTGGQHSPSTPEHASTPAAWAGTGERPFDICGTVAINGASFVARDSALDSGCVDLIERALRAPGFALVDLWELCVAYFVPANHLKPKGLFDLSQELGMPFGVIVERTPERRPAAVRGAVEAAGAGPRSAPELPWPGRVEICMAGSAGQRIRSAAGTMGEIAVGCGLFAAQSDDFPITVRRGHSISHLVIARRAIRYASVERPDVLLVLSEEGAHRAGELIASLEAEAVLVAGDEIGLPRTAARLVRIDLDAVEKLVGKPSAALAALAGGLIAADVTGADALAAAAEACVWGRYREESLRAIETGVSAMAQGLATCSAVNALQENRHDS